MVGDLDSTERAKRFDLLGFAFGVAVVLGSAAVVIALEEPLSTILYGVLLSSPFFLCGFRIVERHQVYFLAGPVMILYAIYEYGVGQMDLVSFLIITLSGGVAMWLGTHHNP